MSTPQTLVVGSGVCGLTLALLLARAGRPVTLVEKQPSIGGYLRRFVRRGMIFDTGYHFSGGFQSVMKQMAEILGIEDCISGTPISNRIILKSGEKEILLRANAGYDASLDSFCREFPGEAGPLREFFHTIQEIWTSRQMHDLRDDTPPQLNFSRYDAITAGEFCERLGLSPAAATAANSFVTCHGTPLNEAPMSFHAKVGFSLYENLARPVNGGEAMIRAFQREAAKLGITIRTNVELLRFAEPDADGNCREARFADGSVLPVSSVFFTIHPHSVSELMPEKFLTPRFRQRISRMRETTSFFCVYYHADDGIDFKPGMISFFSDNDMDQILNGTRGYSTGYMAVKEPDIHGQCRNQITAFRTMPPGVPDQFSALPHRIRRENPAYQEFKARITEEITADLLKFMPQLKGHLHVVESGSPLTCLDYDPPTGSAYGVRCICGQSRFCGQLPVKNFYLAGQSALIPGIMGVMMTSFVVFRTILGTDAYRRVLEYSGRN